MPEKADPVNLPGRLRDGGGGRDKEMEGKDQRSDAHAGALLRRLVVVRVEDGGVPHLVAFRRASPGGNGREPHEKDETQKHAAW